MLSSLQFSFLVLTHLLFRTEEVWTGRVAITAGLARVRVRITVINLAQGFVPTNPLPLRSKTTKRVEGKAGFNWKFL